MTDFDKVKNDAEPLKRGWTGLLLPGVILAALLVIFCFAVPVKARYVKTMEVSLPVTVRLPKLQIPVPAAPAGGIYTGTEISSGLILPEGVTASGDLSGTNAGTYSLRLHLKDSSDSVWADGTSEDKILTWTIQKKTIEKPSASNGVLIDNGASQGPVITGVTEGWVLSSGTVSATAPGEYTAVYSLKDTANTAWTDGTNTPVSFSWGIYVCHTGEKYYTSVEKGFSDNRSTSGSPLILDCNHTENPVNNSGTDWFDLNGKTLTGTVSNSAALTIYGGTVTASGNSADVYPLQNSGTLNVTGGTYQAVSSASESSGKEVWGLYSSGGTAVLSESVELIVQGPKVAACAYQLTGGMVNSAAKITVSTAVGSHGAYYAYLSGGILNVTGGSSNITNTAGFAYLIQAAGGSASVSDGVHRVRANGTASLFLASGGSISVSGGITDLTTTADCNAANVTRGSITLTGGTHTAVSTGGGDSRCLFRTAGTLILNGATVRTGTSGKGLGAHNSAVDTAKTGLQLQSGKIYVKAGTAYCIFAEVANAWVNVNSNTQFYIYYKSAHTCGNYYTSAPVHSVLTTTSSFTYDALMMLSAAGPGMDPVGEEAPETVLTGTFYSVSGQLMIGALSSAEDTMTVEGVKGGSWQVSVSVQNGNIHEVRAFCGEEAEAAAATETLTVSLEKGLSLLSELPPGGLAFEVLEPVFISKIFSMETLSSDGIEPSEVLHPLSGNIGFLLPESKGTYALVLERDAEGKLVSLTLSQEALPSQDGQAEP